MTFAIGHVEGGTNAGRKRPPLEPAGDWPCICVEPPLSQPRFPIKLQDGDQVVIAERKVNRGGLLSCPHCGEKRPGRGRRAGSRSA